jgi:signal transduction histidine kinase
MTAPRRGRTLPPVADSETEFSGVLPSASGQLPDALATRWLRPLGMTVLVVIVVLSLRATPAPALHGSGLSVTVALLALIVALPLLLRHRVSEWADVSALVAVIAACSTLLWTQAGGPGMVGLFFAAGYAAMRLPARASLTLLALAIAAFAVVAAHGHRSVGAIAASALGIVAFYVIAAFAGRVRAAQEQTERLLAELEASRRSQEEAAALRERSRIAREIHDVLAHSLSGLMLQLEGARMLARTPDSNGQLPEALDRAHHLAHAGLEEARRAIGALRDDQLPGPDRLEQLIADFSHDSSIEATLEITGVAHRLDSETSLTLFRVAQEALTNVRKHSRPERVELHLVYESEGTRLTVQDHGARSTALSGHEQQTAASVREGYGLTGMRERAELLGGRLEATPTNDGFRVELWVPA